jgi:hypothetical protein
MTKTTRQQREALARLFSRGPIRPCTRQLLLADSKGIKGVHIAKPLTYRQFRAMVQPTFGCYGAVAVPWCGMYVCIEGDGHAHS